MNWISGDGGFRSRRLLGLLIFSMIVLSASLIAVPANADWQTSSEIHYSPDHIYVLEPFDIALNFSTGQVPASYLTIYSVIMNSSWDSSSVELCPTTLNITPLPSYHVFHRTGTLTAASSAGSYAFTVLVTGQQQGTPSSSTQLYSGSIYILDRPTLTVDISGDKSSGNTPLEVDFTSTVEGGTPDYVYLWTFGDGQTSTLADPTHTFQTSGTYNVTLNVTDQVGRGTVDTFQVTVSDSGILMIVAIVAIVIVVCVVVVVLVMKKKHIPPTKPDA